MTSAKTKVIFESKLKMVQYKKKKCFLKDEYRLKIIEKKSQRHNDYDAVISIYSVQMSMVFHSCRKPNLFSNIIFVFSSQMWVMFGACTILRLRVFNLFTENV